MEILTLEYLQETCQISVPASKFSIECSRIVGLCFYLQSVWKIYCVSGCPTCFSFFFSLLKRNIGLEVIVHVVLCGPLLLSKQKIDA